MTSGAAGFDPARPEFLWDADRLRLIWANADGLAFWGEDELIDLSERVFAPEDETVRALAARLAEIEEGGDGNGRIAFNPKGAPVWARAECRLERRDGRRLLRVSLRCVETPNDATLARMRAGFDAAPEPLAIFGAGGEALARNEADRRAFGAGPFADRYVAREDGVRALGAALADGAFSHKADTLGHAGRSQHRISLRRLRDPATGAAAVIAGFHDLSGRLRPEAAAASRIHDVAALAHDLRAPLTAVQGFAEFIAMSGDAMDATRRADYLADIQTASRRMEALVDRIVAAAAGEAARAQPSAALDLTAIVAEAARLHRPRAEAAGVSLIVEADPAQAAAALGDAATVHRILDNLVENALRHGLSRGGALTLTVKATPGEATAGEAVVEVRDNGAGMAQETLDALLSRAGTARFDASGRAGGLGLGNAAGLAASLGGRLEARSAPGQGFVARLHLPSG